MNTLTYPYCPTINDLWEGNITPQGPALQIVADRILDAVRTFIAETESLGLTNS